MDSHKLRHSRSFLMHKCDDDDIISHYFDVKIAKKREKFYCFQPGTIRNTAKNNFHLYLSDFGLSKNSQMTAFIHFMFCYEQN